MKKKDVFAHPFGSARFVVAHAQWKKIRGRRPSMKYAGVGDPEEALMIAIQNVEAEEREKEVIKHLKKPMLKCLARLMGEIKDQLQYWNEKVLKEAGVNLGLEFVSATQIAEEKWRVVVVAYDFAKRRAENIFTLEWWSHTCPAHYQLFIRGRAAWTGEPADLYSGVVRPSSRIIARELAIYSHGQQIRGVLSRF